MDTVVFKIEGMRCERCASLIRALLERSEGVREAAVSYARREGEVRYDPVFVGEDALADAIDWLGYRVASRTQGGGSA